MNLGFRQIRQLHPRFDRELFNHAKVMVFSAIPGYKISPGPLCNKNMPLGKSFFGERSEARTHLVFVHTTATDEEEVSIGKYECFTGIKKSGHPF